MMDKVTDLAEAIRTHVHDGDVVVMEGFTHLIPFAAAHEIIRQRRRNLTLVRLTPDVIYDQMIGAGCCAKLVFSWAGNPGVGSLHAFRRCGAGRDARHRGVLAFWPGDAAVRRRLGPAVHADPRLLRIGPAEGQSRDQAARLAVRWRGLYAVSAITPDVAILHAQRADADGNVQVWGLTGVQREAAFASKRVIVTVEEIVSRDVIRADPNRTLIPGLVVLRCLSGAVRCSSVVRAGVLRSRHRLLRADGTKSAATRTRSHSGSFEWVEQTPSREAYVERLGPGTSRCPPADSRTTRIR